MGVLPTLQRCLNLCPLPGYVGQCHVQIFPEPYRLLSFSIHSLGELRNLRDDVTRWWMLIFYCRTTEDTDPAVEVPEQITDLLDHLEPRKIGVILLAEQSEACKRQQSSPLENELFPLTGTVKPYVLLRRESRAS